MEIALDWEVIKAQLPDGWRELATEMGLIRDYPASMNTKVKDIEQLLRLEFHRAGLQSSLKETTAEASAAGLIELSSVALHKWEYKLSPYLARLLVRMTEAGATFACERWAGFDVILADATTVQRPGSRGTTARVRYAMRLSDLTFLHLEATDEHEGETFRVFHATPGQLWIGDRCYANPPGIMEIVQSGAHALVRYNRGALPLYGERGEEVDVLRLVRTLRQLGQCGEWKVWVHPSDGFPIRGRLCAVRLPDDKVEQARARLREEYRSHVSAEALEAAKWLIVFTTVPTRRLPIRRVLELYRMRWQIELEIKREKSIDGLDKLPNFLTPTIQTWLYIKLLLQQIGRKIVSDAVAFPPSGARLRVRPAPFASADDEVQAAPADQARGWKGPPRPQARRRRDARRTDAPAAA
jgi:Transposase DDE domain